MLNKQLEHALIGMLLYAPDGFSRVSHLLTAADFTDPQAARVWDCMCKMDERGLAIDSPGVFAIAKQLYSPDEAFALASYCSAQFTACRSTVSLVPVAEAVADDAARRRLASVGADITKDADSPRSVSDLLSDADQRLSELSLCLTREQDGPLPMDEVIAETLRFVSDHRAEGRTITGLRTGFARLDETTLGLQPTDFIVIAARPGVGKTTLGLNLALNIARNGAPVGFVSIEMGRQQIALRVLSAQHHIPHTKLRAADLSEADLAKIQASAFPCSSSGLASSRRVVDSSPHSSEQEPLSSSTASGMWLLDSSACTVADIHRNARRLVKDHGIRCLIVDYLQLIRGAPAQRQQTREQEVAQISRGLKAMAKELDITVIALAQLNRNIEQRRLDGGRPQLSDLRESGSIEQDADIVCFIHKMVEAEAESHLGDCPQSCATNRTIGSVPDVRRTGDSVPDSVEESLRRGTLVSLIIAKHRNGLCCDIPLLFQPDYCLFTDFSN